MRRSTSLSKALSAQAAERQGVEQSASVPLQPGGEKGGRSSLATRRSESTGSGTSPRNKRVSFLGDATVQMQKAPPSAPVTPTLSRSRTTPVVAEAREQKTPQVVEEHFKGKVFARGQLTEVTTPPAAAGRRLQHAKTMTPEAPSRSLPKTAEPRDRKEEQRAAPTVPVGMDLVAAARARQDKAGYEKKATQVLSNTTQPKKLVLRKAATMFVSPASEPEAEMTPMSFQGGEPEAEVAPRRPRANTEPFLNLRQRTPSPTGRSQPGGRSASAERRQLWDVARPEPGDEPNAGIQFTPRLREAGASGSVARSSSASAESAPSAPAMRSLLRSSSADGARGRRASAFSDMRSETDSTNNSVNLRRRSTFGVGERIDVHKYTEQKTKTKAHDAAVVQQLSLGQQKFLRERQEYDEELMHTLHDREGSTTPRQRSSTPRSTNVPMRTAFTDRALRMRDSLSTVSHGHGVEVEFDGADPVARNSALQAKPAGQPSHNCPRKDAPASYASFGIVSSTHQGKKQPQDMSSRTFNSSGVNATMTVPKDDKGENELSDAGVRKVLGLQGKVKARPRAASADGTSVAGAHRRRGFLLEDDGGVVDRRYLGCPPSPTARISSMMQIISPRAVAEVSSRITSCKKGEGEMKSGLSADSEKVHVHWNQPLYRYEVWSAERRDWDPRRSRSQPPEDYYGSSDCGSPRTPRNPVSGTPAETRSFLDDKRTFRQGKANRSSSFRKISNHEEMAKENARARNSRLASDQHFAEMCAHTTLCSRASDRENLIETKHHKSSAAFASAFQWPTE